MTEPFSIVMFDYQRVPFGNLRWLSQVARGMMENHTIYIHCKKMFSLSHGHFLPCLMMGGQKCPWSKISRARQCLVMVLENFAWGASISDLFRSKSPWVWRPSHIGVGFGNPRHGRIGSLLKQQHHRFGTSCFLSQRKWGSTAKSEWDEEWWILVRFGHWDGRVFPIFHWIYRSSLAIFAD